MTVVRAQCAFTMDTAFPRDKIAINPVFELTGAIEDADALAEALADALTAWKAAACELTVKTYDVQGTRPVYPNGQAVNDVGIIGASGSPREIALCLSFYAERNVPRQRGRLYVPFCLQSTSSTVGRRPTVPQQQRVADLVPIFAGLGGPDVDWGIWSTRDNEFRKVTNWWVDNEWDVIRSRGQRSDSRLSGTTSG
jgi:hypothetical protein